MSRSTTNLMKLWKSPSYALFMGTALIVGIGTGLGAVAFRFLIRGVEWVGYDWFPRITQQWGNAYVVIIPAIGGLIVGPLIYFFAREAKGHGVPEVMAAVALQRRSYSPCGGSGKIPGFVHHDWQRRVSGPGRADCADRFGPGLGPGSKAGVIR